MVRLTEAARDVRVEERRSQILTAALAVFSRKGFHGATIREIASAAGLAEGTIYLYFASKQEVLQGVFGLIAEEASAPPAAETIADGSDETFLSALIRDRIRSLVRHAPFLRLCVHEADLHESLRRELFARLYEPFVAQLEAYLRARIAQGAFRPMNTALTAAICFRMMMSYVMVQHVLAADRVTPPHTEEEYIGAMVALILHGLTARPASTRPS